MGLFKYFEVRLFFKNFIKFRLKRLRIACDFGAVSASKSGIKKNIWK